MKKISRLAVYGLVIQAQKVLLVRENKGIFKGLLHFPGGKMEFGETFEETLKREFKEEVDMGFTDFVLLENEAGVHEIPIDGKMHLVHWIKILYKITGCYSLSEECVTNEILEFVWGDIKKLNFKELSPFVQKNLQKFGAIL